MVLSEHKYIFRGTGKLLQDLNHKHILVTAEGLKNPPSTAEIVSNWLIELVSLVDMNVLMGPYSIRCETEGNEGCTGAIVIETSHASLHCWDTGTTPFLKMDLYSCKDFDKEKIFEHLKVFQPSGLDFLIVDRNGRAMVTDSGYIAL